MSHFEHYAVEEAKNHQLMEKALSESAAEAADRGYEAVEKGAVGSYKAIEKGTVGTYKAIENAVVGAYRKTEDFFVEKFFTRPGETPEEAKRRMQNSAEK